MSALQFFRGRQSLVTLLTYIHDLTSNKQRIESIAAVPMLVRYGRNDENVRSRNIPLVDR